MIVTYISPTCSEPVTWDYGDKPLIEIISELRVLGVSRASFSPLPLMRITTIQEVQLIKQKLEQLASH